MSPRVVLLTALFTAVAVVAALLAVLQRPYPTSVDLDAEPAFATLSQSPEAVARIEISGGDGSVTLVHDDQGSWTVAEKAGYPAKPEAIGALVLGFAELRLAEAKTARPHRYSRLGVEDVSAANSGSRRVRMLDGEGTVLADVIVGRRVFSATGGRSAGTYLRRTGEVQAWLASGGVSVDTDPVDWLNPEIVDVDAAAVRRVAVTLADGAAYVAERAGAGDPLALNPVPEGREPLAAAVERLAGLLDGITLIDVAPAGSLEDAEPVAATIVETFDDRVVRIDLVKVATDRWATFTVAGEEGAGGLAERVEGWTYRLRAGVADRMAPALTDLLEPAEPAGGS